ncbi:SHOCT domain-containing protein [Pseudonocardia sp. NPDC049154]|jgi:hypothetical protein|uniref:SHOCT domain-containing protein n=1 Tax=Pseudonocardia sp. NPDC049154 TaxID=3155501 RepID=UPI0033C62051
MPGLLRGLARTAIIAGTASSVAGRVQRHQARKFADRDAETAAERERAYEAQMEPQGGYAPAPPPAPAPAAAGGSDVITQLKQLAELRDQGVLTDDEFAAQKARILG